MLGFLKRMKGGLQSPDPNCKNQSEDSPAADRSPKRPRDADEECTPPKKSKSETPQSGRNALTPRGGKIKTPSSAKNRSSQHIKANESNEKKSLSKENDLEYVSPAEALESRRKKRQSFDVTPPNFTAAMKQVRRDKIRKKRVWDLYFSSLSVKQPCPGCGFLMNTTDFDFEISQIVPRDIAGDALLGEWNCIPLCSHVPEDTSDYESDNETTSTKRRFVNNDSDLDGPRFSKKRGWGCSELLERQQCITVEMLDDGLKSNDPSQSFHALDWMILNHPTRVHEMLIRLQRAHGDLFNLPVSETLCLRFVRDVYQRGHRPLTEDNETGNQLVQEWNTKRLGFVSDIIDVAECFRNATDKEVLRRVEFKDMLTPKKSIQNKSLPTPRQSIVRPVSENRNLISIDDDKISTPVAKNLGVSFKDGVLTRSNTKVSKDSDDDSDFENNPSINTASN